MPWAGFELARPLQVTVGARLDGLEAVTENQVTPSGATAKPGQRIQFLGILTILLGIPVVIAAVAVASLAPAYWGLIYVAAAVPALGICLTICGRVLARWHPV